MSTNVFSGARAVFKIGESKVAFASNVDIGEEITYEPVDVLDNVEVQEFVPTGYRVTFTCGIFRTIAGGPFSLSSPGSAPEAIGQGTDPKQGTHGSLRGMNIYPKSTKAILTSGVLSASIMDRLSQKVIMTVQECKAATLNYSVTARGIVAQNLSFVAIRVKDEDSE